MKREDKRAAVAAYKRRETAAGIYAVRCAATDQCWVGSAPDIGTIRNRLWFTLRQGTNPHRSLQDAWSQHGEDSFAFEQVEKLDADLNHYARERTLKTQLAYWIAELKAEAI
jgi:hypothetical protein